MIIYPSAPGDLQLACLTDMRRGCVRHGGMGRRNSVHIRRDDPTGRPGFCFTGAEWEDLWRALILATSMTL